MNTQLNDFLKARAQNKHLHVTLGASLLLEVLATKSREAGPVVIITKDEEAFIHRLRNLRFFQKQSDFSLVSFPEDALSVYHKAAKDPLVAMEQLRCLLAISLGVKNDIVLMSAKSLIKKVPNAHELIKHTLILAAGDTISRDALINSLIRLGYVRVSQVLDRGTFAVRGSVIDVYVGGEKDPIRIDLFGDTIDSIRFFDTSTQRNLAHTSPVVIGGVKEILFDSETKERAITQLTALADDIDYPTQALNEKLRDIENSIYFYGIEKLLPAFMPDLTTPLSLLALNSPKDSPVTLFFDDRDAIMRELRDFYQNAESLYNTALARQDLVYAPKYCYAHPDDLAAAFDAFPQVDFSTMAKTGAWVFPSHDTQSIRTDVLQSSIALKNDSNQHLLAPVASKIRALHHERKTVIISISSSEHESELRKLLTPLGINLAPIKHLPAQENLFKDHVHAYTLRTQTPLHFGGIFDFLDLALISENDIFGERSKRAQSSGKQKGFATVLGDLNIDDYVVHVDHGIGQFKGIARLNMRGVDNDYVLLTYQNAEKLYLPVHRINLIKPYGQQGAATRLDKLGGTGWTSKKKKVKEAVMSMAQDLLKLYAKREVSERPPVVPPDAHYFEFESAFTFEPTPDQAKAFEDVMRDMQRKQPMDRLICGDVGYGKTEVCMRAAMLAVINGRQVAVLAPTTVLAQQHGITFTERFKNTGVTIEVVSRFLKPAQIKEIIERVKRHKTDIVIGTHRLLSNDVEFPNLGLIVIDEEQRFGIKDKEHLKKLKTKIDVLCMSATPIPRTLQMSFFGIRDLSIIETPPVDRLAIQTSIVEFDDALIREAILREIHRGGQVYFVHNRVSSIEAIAEYLRALVPESRVAFAHGQMSETALENEMVRFMNHEINVLVCTTIIETGIDVSSANTMFINDADDFGLSQLYQLRGRIGRSKERAFAYLLIKGSHNLSDIAKARLDILHKFSDLGAGFKIAQHDLELRGAGDLLGKNQHGHMAAVGYDLYAELLKDAVHSIKGQKEEEAFDPEVILPVSALISQTFCPDLHDRMSYYQRLAYAATSDEIDNIFHEMEDSFSTLPDEVLALQVVGHLKLRLKDIRALKIEITRKEQDFVVAIVLSATSPIDKEKLMAAMTKPGDLHITPQQKVIQVLKNQEPHIIAALKNVAERAIKNIVEALF